MTSAPRHPRGGRRTRMATQIPLNCAVVLGTLFLYCTLHVEGACRTTAISDSAPKSPNFLTNPSTPTRYTFDQERVAAYVAMPTALDQNPREECPFSINTATLKWWHDAATWASQGSKVPAAGSDVTLPENTRVLATDCSFASAGYKKLTIPASSELIFMDAAATLTVKQIDIFGALRIGAPKCRMYATITINLSALQNESATYNGGINVQNGGVLEMHGKQFHPSWTRLASNVTIGNTVVWLQHAVNWEPGQRILLATSQYRDEEKVQNEVVVLRAKSSDGKKLEFTTPLKFNHYAGPEYQTEIALLSRRIVVQSPGDNKWGGHMMCMGPNGKCRWSGVAAKGLGQTNVIGRYPFHFHSNGLVAPTADPETHFVRDCSCESTNYRCVVVHGWNKTHVARNVAYNVTGHAFYLEDGVEEENIVEYNFAAFVHTIFKNASGSSQGGETFSESAELAQPSDVSAAGFYFPNLRNTIRGNAASGGWTGFALPIMTRPIGTHKAWGMNPSARPSLLFDGNTAHSSGYFWNFGAGACMYSGGDLTYNSNGKYTYNTGRNERGTLAIDGVTKAWIPITNTKVWLCNLGLNMWGERMDVTKYESHDCARSLQLFGESSLTHALCEGRSRNPVAAIGSKDFESTVMGFQMYDTRVKTVVYNVTFRNYTMGETMSSSVWTALTHSDIFKPWYITGTAKISYVNIDTRLLHRRPLMESGSYRMFNWIDWDGSAILRGRGCSPAIIGSSSEWWNAGTGCKFEPQWQTWICDRLVGREVGNLEFLATGMMVSEGCNGDCLDYQGETLTQAQRDTLYVGWVAQLGQPKRKIIATKNRGISGFTGIGWFPYWNQGTPRDLTIRPRMVQRGQFIIVALRYNTCPNLQVWINHHYWKRTNLTLASSLGALVNGTGMEYFQQTDTYGCIVWLKIVNVLTDYGVSYYERENIRIWRESWPGEFDYRVQVGNMQGNDVLTIPSGKTADVLIPPAPVYSTPECPNGEADLNKTFANAPWKYRYTCSPKYACPGACTACEGTLGQCREWTQLANGTYTTAKLMANAACNDGKASTINDKCSSDGKCKAVDEKSVPPLIFSDLQQWYLSLRAVPSDNITRIYVTDNRGTTKDLVRSTNRYERERWSSGTTSAFYGDCVVSTVMQWGTTINQTMPDISKVANKALTLTKKSNNMWWLQLSVSPWDFVKSAEMLVRGYTVPMTGSYESFSNPSNASLIPAGFDKRYFGDITFKFTFFNGTVYSYLWPNWEPTPTEKQFHVEEAVEFTQVGAGGAHHHKGTAVTNEKNEIVGLYDRAVSSLKANSSFAVSGITVFFVVGVAVMVLMSRRGVPIAEEVPMPMSPVIQPTPPSPAVTPTEGRQFLRPFADEGRVLTPASLPTTPAFGSQEESPANSNATPLQNSFPTSPMSPTE